MNTLDFIEDTDLRKTLEDSIEYIYALYERSKTEKNDLYKEETYRVIIVYVISAIEAVLLYLYKVRGEKLEYNDYKYVQFLNNKYIHKDKPNLTVVVAVLERVEKQEYQISLHDLIMFFLEKKLIQKSTADDILEKNDIRNTLHFSKTRTKKCDLSKVEEAFKLLLYTLERAPKALLKK